MILECYMKIFSVRRRCFLGDTSFGEKYVLRCGSRKGRKSNWQQAGESWPREHNFPLHRLRDEYLFTRQHIVFRATSTSPKSIAKKSRKISDKVCKVRKDGDTISVEADSSFLAWILLLRRVTSATRTYLIAGHGRNRWNRQILSSLVLDVRHRQTQTRGIPSI